MKAYSVDLRQRVIEAYQNKEGSQRQLAKRFKLSRSTIQAWLKSYDRDKTMTPKPRGGRALKLEPAAQEQLTDLLKTHADATLAEHTQRLAEATGQRIHPSTLWRYAKRLGYSYKKNTTRQ